jgi:hypothetical protein
MDRICPKRELPETKEDNHFRSLSISDIIRYHISAQRRGESDNTFKIRTVDYCNIISKNIPLKFLDNFCKVLKQER